MSESDLTPTLLVKRRGSCTCVEDTSMVMHVHCSNNIRLSA
jgi:hypothetical protein